jgi:hypothetical protein
MLCSLLVINRRFAASFLFCIDFLLDLIIDPEDGIGMFLRNVGDF